MSRRYSNSDIKNMTLNFKDKLGLLRFGSVYRAELLKVHLVAPDVVWSKYKGLFINEVAAIGRMWSK